MNTPSVEPRRGDAVVVAVDGILATTPTLRAAALREACDAEGVRLEADGVDRWLVGRSLEEGVAALAPRMTVQRPSPSDGTTDHVGVDPGQQTVLVLRAQRALGRRMAHGVLLRPGVVDRVRTLMAQGVRVVWRADSDRSVLGWMDADPALAGLGTLVRAADDRPGVAGASSLVASYRAIMARGVAWGVAPDGWWGWELPGGHAILEEEALPVRALPSTTSDPSDPTLRATPA
jgi:beta-phosphoglucomutase-like phosphatase (HAD superfamily)